LMGGCGGAAKKCSLLCRAFDAAVKGTARAMDGSARRLGSIEKTAFGCDW
jgi:hypothetical protein